MVYGCLCLTNYRKRRRRRRKSSRRRECPELPSRSPTPRRFPARECGSLPLSPQPIPIIAINVDPMEPMPTLQETIGQLQVLEVAATVEFLGTIEDLKVVSTLKIQEVGDGCTSALLGLDGTRNGVQQAGQPTPKQGLYHHSLDDHCRQLQEKNAKLKKEAIHLF